MSLAQKTAWIIERNMDRPLGLESLAEANGVSRSHLARAFGAAVGKPVVAYLRGRRLTCAAAALAAGAPDILQVALEAGYASHEAFTRAFRDQFGVTPEAVRGRASTAGLDLTAPVDLSRSHGVPRLRHRLVEEPLLRVVGMSEMFPCGPSFGITKLWQRFAPYIDAIPAKKEAMPVGVSYNFTDDAGFHYLAGLEVISFVETAVELTEMEIPASRYAVFTHAGHVAGLPETFRAIWDKILPEMGLKAADTPSLERHLPTFNPLTGEGGVDVWIPLEG